MSQSIIYTHLLCSLLLINLVTCKRILMVPFMNTSHTKILHVVASRLAARGHSVTVLWDSESSNRDIIRNPNYTLIEFSTRKKLGKPMESFESVLTDFANEQNNFTMPSAEMGWLTSFKNYMNIARSNTWLSKRVSSVANTMCKAVLSDAQLMDRLREQRFDIALVDDINFGGCLFLIPHSLGIILTKSVFNLLILYICIRTNFQICFF